MDVNVYSLVQSSNPLEQQQIAENGRIANRMS